MTTQRLIDDFAAWLYERDSGTSPYRYVSRVSDAYVNEAAVFLAGELGQRLQRSRAVKKGDRFDWSGVRVEVLRVDKSGGWADIKSTGPTGLSWTKRQLLPFSADFKPVGSAS